jgi:hypothetical protein
MISDPANRLPFADFVKGVFKLLGGDGCAVLPEAFARGHLAQTRVSPVHNLPEPTLHSKREERLNACDGSSHEPRSGDSAERLHLPAESQRRSAGTPLHRGLWFAGRQRVNSVWVGFKQGVSSVLFPWFSLWIRYGLHRPCDSGPLDSHSVPRTTQSTALHFVEALSHRKRLRHSAETRLRAGQAHGGLSIFVVSVAERGFNLPRQ